MTKLTNPFDSTGHRFVMLTAILLLFMSVGTALAASPVTTETVSFGASLGETVRKIFLVLFSAGTACIGLAISASAIRVTKRKKKTPINKQAVWYLFFYFVVLILPVLLLSMGA